MHPGRAWLNTGLAFAAMFVSVGTGFSYGALVLPVTRDLGLGQGTAAGVFAVTIMVFFLAGAPAGMVSDRVGTRWVLLLGAVALAAGLVTTARADGAAGLYLGHGVLVGLAMASTFIPLSVTVNSSFERHRTLALGVAVSGIGLGTLVMAPLIAYLIRSIGWREAYLALGVAGGLVLLLASLFVARPTLPVSRHGHGPPLGTSLRSRPYRLLYAAQVLLSIAIFTPFSHLPAYAEQTGSDAVTAAGLVGIVGAASVLGRLALGSVAERAGLLVTYRMCFFVVGLSFAFWLWPEGPYPVLVVHAVAFGVGYGGYVALLPAVLAERFGLRRLGGLLGLIYTSNVIGAGLGPLLTGLLIERYGYVPAGGTALVCALAGALLLGRLDPAPTNPGEPAAQASPSRR